MQIYELDYDMRRDMLNEQIGHLKNIQESIAEKRDKYREFSRLNNIDFNSLYSCCKMYERSVLIDVYTLSEQLVKNSYYQLIDKDGYNNDCLKRFINEKVNPNKFSPNVLYTTIEKSISKELSEKFKFIYNKNNDEVQSYNNMVQARHIYAHSGNYLFDNEKFEDVVKVIDYMHMEFSILICEGNLFRFNFQEDFRKLNTLTKDAEKLISQLQYENKEKREALKSNFSELKLQCKKIVDMYDRYLSTCELFNEVYEKIKSIRYMDLRSLDSCIQKFNKTKDIIKQSFI